MAAVMKTRSFLILSILGLGVACGGDDPAGGGGAPPLTAAQQFCSTLSESVKDCVTTPCDDALVADCAGIAAVLADPLLLAAGSCLAGDGTPTSCLVEGVKGLATTDAHVELAASFCGGCALGVPGCEEAFFDPEAEGPRLGSLMLPFGDDVVREVTSACTTSLGCAATFSTCVQETLAKRAVPEQTIGCLVESLLAGPGAAPATCGGGAGGEGGAAAGPTSTSTSASSSASSSASASSSSASTGGSSGGCDPVDPCAAAPELELSGDDPTTTTAEGHGSAWYRVEIAETDTGIFPNGFGVRFELSAVPAGSVYELWVYGDGGCAAPTVQGSGSPLVVEDTWPDTQALDERTVNVEVRHVSGPCAASAPWTLTVESF
jgi:hypothetical protein